MTTEEKTLLAVLTAAAVLVSAALGGALGWPMWSWLLLAVPLLSVPGLMARNIQRRVRPEWLREGYVAAPVQEVEQQPQDQQIPVADVTLPSAADGYAFHFSATVYWSPMGGSALQHANLAGLAADAVVSRARAITVTEQPSQVDAVAHRLAGALGAVQRDASGGVHAWADQVQLTLPEADQARLRRLSDARKDEDIWERELNYERCKRAYLADDVLRSTGSAVVWWLVQKDNDVEGTRCPSSARWLSFPPRPMTRRCPSCSATSSPSRLCQTRDPWSHWTVTSSSRTVRSTMGAVRPSGSPGPASRWDRSRTPPGRSRAG